MLFSLRARRRSRWARSPSRRSRRACISNDASTALPSRWAPRLASRWKPLNSSEWAVSAPRNSSRRRLRAASISTARFLSVRSASRSSRGCRGRRGRRSASEAVASSTRRERSQMETISARRLRWKGSTAGRRRSMASGRRTGAGTSAGTSRSSACRACSLATSCSSARVSAWSKPSLGCGAERRQGSPRARCHVAAGGATPRTRCRYADIWSTSIASDGVVGAAATFSSDMTYESYAVVDERWGDTWLRTMGQHVKHSGAPLVI